MRTSNKRPRAPSAGSLGSQSSRQVNRRAAFLSRRSSVSSTYDDCGDCLYVCASCFAYFWPDEKLASSTLTGPPKYNQCCRNGGVRLRSPNSVPAVLKDMLDDPHFMHNIRRYNSMFAMTSFGAKVDDDINDGSAPYVFKVEGQVCHRIGSVCPGEDTQPSFLQLYVYDTENEVSNRLRIFDNDRRQKLRPQVVLDMIHMLESNNELVKLFRHARDVCLSSDVPEFSIRLFSSQNERSYDLPVSGSLGAIVFGDDSVPHDYDIIIHQKDVGPKRISKLHPSYMPLQYPLLFPFGESGWSKDLKAYTDSGEKRLTMNKFYSYQLHDRRGMYSLLLRGGRLLQQYIVDAYVCIEQNRLDYIRRNQNLFRTELLRGLHDAILRGDTEGQSVGRRTFLPSSFTGGPRYMYKHYQDALAICRVYGNPQYFITFTCNVTWPEILRYMAQFPRLKAQDRPDIITRIFQMKVKSLVTYLKKAKPFGKVAAHLYTIEFQKRGLPHCHMLLWVEDSFKIRTPEEIDRYISAEIPDHALEPELYKIVSELMIHGPCGPHRVSSPCMAPSGTCSKNFPKDYEESTTLDTNGYAHYKRRRQGFKVIKNGTSIDNGYVVPYNKTLSLRYSAHINVEYCGWSMMIKYLFKYISKGSDRIRFAITKKASTANDEQATEPEEVDEVKNFVDGRFICPHEASWRIFNYPIHERSPAVQVLAVHLDGMQCITFRDTDNLEEITDNAFMKKTTLTEWLQNNRYDHSGRHLRYVDYLKEFRWDVSDKMWLRRKYRKIETIGRLRYIHPTCGDAFYLRMLLCHQVGCCTFADIRTVGGHVCETNREACQRLGLLGDDKEWLHTFEEASFTASSRELRSLFTHMLLFCEVTEPLKLWEQFWEKMSDDITYDRGFMNHEDLQQIVLYEIELLLRTHSSSASLTNYGLPLPNTDLMAALDNKLLMEEKNYDRPALSREHELLRANLHPQQKTVYEYVKATLNSKQQVLAFVYGHGGTGKTYLWKTIISALRSKGEVVLAVAASGIASLLLPSGRTAHSRFRLPIELTNQSMCNITKNTNLAQLLIEASLIVWDEAPMSERNCLECLDRTLQDLLDAPGVPFGGKSVLLGGDFRQTLPIKRKAPKSKILEMSLPRSQLWPHFKMFKLTENMRLHSPHLTSAQKNEVAEFSAWLLSVGDGTAGVTPDVAVQDTKIIQIPEKFLIPHGADALSDLITFIYDPSTLSDPSPQTMAQKAIVCPTNETVDEINSLVLHRTLGEVVTYLSYDSITPHVSNHGETEILYPIEYLNTLHFNGLPPHQLQLKPNTPIILLRNINQTLGLCNGTRLIVSQLLPNIIEAHIMTGTTVGKRVYIPRISLIHNDKELPFSFKRKQFPVKVCYAMTINKSQGQSLNKIGIYLPHPVFSHGQLYVALSRATSPNALKIVIEPKEGQPDNITENIVYTEYLAEIEKTQA